METVVCGDKKYGLHSFVSTEGGVVAVVVSDDGSFVVKKLSEIRLVRKTGRKPKESDDCINV